FLFEEPKFAGFWISFKIYFWRISSSTRGSSSSSNFGGGEALCSIFSLHEAL
ncbi:hypothetical protein KI387_030076, partial [Taxus chinensis]